MCKFLDARTDHSDLENSITNPKTDGGTIVCRTHLDLPSFPHQHHSPHTERSCPRVHNVHLDEAHILFPASSVKSVINSST